MPYVIKDILNNKYLRYSYCKENGDLWWTSDISQAKVYNTKKGIKMKFTTMKFFKDSSDEKREIKSVEVIIKEK